MKILHVKAETPEAIADAFKNIRGRRWPFKEELKVNETHRIETYIDKTYTFYVHFNAITIFKICGYKYENS